MALKSSRKRSKTSFAVAIACVLTHSPGAGEIA
jgi:hypothetical protein